jgi:hypothetical protein
MIYDVILILIFTAAVWLAFETIRILLFIIAFIAITWNLDEPEEDEDFEDDCL